MQSVGLVWMLGGLLWVLPVAYVVVRWRSYREASPADPQLGLKLLLYYFRMIGFDLLLVAAGCAVYALLASVDDRVAPLRIVAGLGVSGGLIWGAHRALIDRYTNTVAFPMIAITFNAINVAVTGLLGAVSLVIFAVMMFQSEPGGAALKGVLSTMLVSVPAWVHQTAMLARRVSLSRPASP